MTPTPHSSQLRHEVRKDARNRPGVYRFLGPRNEVLYVGKSVRIRNRLLSYFRKEGKEAELLRVTRQIRWEYVPHELEALLREFRLIRAFRPRFNVRHRRERTFAWVRLTAGPAPRLMATRSPRNDGSRFFGPFPAPRSLPAQLRELSVLLRLRDCPQGTPIHYADQLDLLASSRAPGCLRAEMGSCPGPCAALCTEAAYRHRVQKAVEFLEGRSDEPLTATEARMRQAACSQEFELAARLRDRLDRIRTLRDRILEFERYLASLNFLYTPVLHQTSGDEDPVSSGETGLDQQAGGGESSARNPLMAGPYPNHRTYLILRGRLRLILPHGDPSSLPPHHPRAVAFTRILNEPPTPSEELTADQREELFLVARWFKKHPEERRHTRPPPSPVPAPVPQDPS